MTDTREPVTHRCGTCGWDWDADEAENRTALNERLAAILQAAMDANPDLDWSLKGLKERWPLDAEPLP